MSAQACKYCGESMLYWHSYNTVTTEVSEGRLRSNEVSALFVLSCEYCSETLKKLTIDDVIKEMNAALTL